MDCNNYSYVNHSVKSAEIARYYGDDRIIIIERVINYFGEMFYTVYDILGDFVEEFYIDHSEGWETERHAYEKAARCYNSLVPDNECITLF